ncbi:MAG: hypothetical protein NWF01_03080 [Candidatus Bathyarchaeota archaeon]|nr:hypothetical protein [Candidatus Bathyarchaeota archaeon]
MSKKIECRNTDYTKGFSITRENGVFVATKDKVRLTAATAEEINKLIQNQK